MLEGLSELLYPNGIKCIACNTDVPNSDCVCGDCRLNKIEKYCLKCGRAIEFDSDYCIVCKSRTWHFDYARCAYEFDEPFRRIIHNFKYGGGKYLAVYLADFILESINNAIKNDGLEFDFITFAPMHKKRQKERGYNQAQLLADKIGEMSGKEVIPALIKNRKVQSLAKLNAEMRQKEIDSSVSLDYNVITLKKSEEDKKQYLKGKTALLIDDVFTSGATSNECSKILRTAGVEKVYVFTAASLKTKHLLI